VGFFIISLEISINKKNNNSLMIINALDKTVNIKIVYFGPALSGKTTSLKALFNHFGKIHEVKSIENSVNRTLFFDYGTLTFQNEQWELKIHVYSTTGQDFYFITRPTTLKAMDGIIFVADSQKTVYERNIISWNELAAYYKDTIESLPLMICFNKQDLPDKFNSMVFLDEIKIHEYQSADVNYTIAVNGDGIILSFETMLKLIFKDLTKSELISRGGQHFLNS